MRYLRSQILIMMVLTGLILSGCSGSKEPAQSAPASTTVSSSDPDQGTAPATAEPATATPASAAALGTVPPPPGGARYTTGEDAVTDAFLEAAIAAFSQGQTQKVQRFEAFLTPDSIDEITAFYTDEMPRRGWTVRKVSETGLIATQTSDINIGAIITWADHAIISPQYTDNLVTIIVSLHTPEPLPAGTIQKGSLANEQLGQDSMIGVVAKTAALGCDSIESVTPYVVSMPEGTVGARSWQERWIITGCDSSYPIDITFSEDGLDAANYTIE